jgi:hypothetical protein
LEKSSSLVPIVFTSSEDDQETLLATHGIATASLGKPNTSMVKSVLSWVGKYYNGAVSYDKLAEELQNLAPADLKTKINEAVAAVGSTNVDAAAVEDDMTTPISTPILTSNPDSENEAPAMETPRIKPSTSTSTSSSSSSGLLLRRLLDGFSSMTRKNRGSRGPRTYQVAPYGGGGRNSRKRRKKSTQLFIDRYLKKQKINK